MNSGVGTNPSTGSAQAQKGIQSVAHFYVQRPGAASTGSFRFAKTRVVIGSVISADIRLTGEGISPIHAVIELDLVNGGTRIYDLASQTGIKVKGSSTVAADLKPGDEVSIGGHKLSYKVEAIAPIPTSEAASAQNNPDEDLRPLLLESEADIVDIFDYRPDAGKKAIEVVMSWRGSILDVQHFVEVPEITIGDSQLCDFGIPAILGKGALSLVHQHEGQYYLVVTDQMTGVMQSKGQVLTVDELRGGVKKNGRGYSVVLGENDFAKVSAGEIDFYVSFTQPPPHLKKRNFFDRDPFFARIMGSSLAFMSALALVFMTVEPPEQVKVEKMPDRIARILYQPERYTYYRRPPNSRAPELPVTTPTKVKKSPKSRKRTKMNLSPDSTAKRRKKAKTFDPNAKTGGSKTKKARGRVGRRKSGPRQGREGEGARAKGMKGKRGTKTSRRSSTKAKTAARRTSPRAGKGRGGSRSQVRGDGNVQALKGASNRISNLLGASIQRLGKSGQKLEGFSTFSSQGNGGLALSGRGTGGGGNADSLGGLGKKGRGGGRVGTGVGAAGSGGNILGGSVRVNIRSGGVEETVVLGAIDRNEVLAAINEHMDEFRLCYEREINAEKPDLRGKISTAFTIGPRGKVTKAGVKSTSMNNANVEGCVIQVIRRIDFPRPRGGGVVDVNYPFSYSRSGR